MKRILFIARRDLKSGLRDFLVVYLFLAPVLFALLLRLFAGGVAASPLRVAVFEDGAAIASALADYAHVEPFATRDALLERVLRLDDVLGVVATSAGHELVAEGNEMPGTDAAVRLVLYRLGAEEGALPAIVEISDIGFTLSPFILQGGLLLLIMTTVFGGMLILLNLIEEKMSNTLSAMNVTPASRLEFILGKGLLGFLTPVLGGSMAVYLLGFRDFNLGMFLVSMVSLAFISLIIGFLVGVTNDEPISGIAAMKGVFVPVLASVLGATLLAERWQFVLYWSPFYWGYLNMNAILLGSATWGEVLRNSTIILVITGIVFAALRPRIARGLR
ncbi:MAG: ABC transporter permease [Thermaerobacter sp.]|nr:ABC transporter permease [Thermaerobacter sp.]